MRNDRHIIHLPKTYLIWTFDARQSKTVVAGSFKADNAQSALRAWGILNKVENLALYHVTQFGKEQS